MKWFHRLFAAVAVAMAAVACTLDPLAESESGGEPEDVTFDVGIKDVLTKADNTPLDNAGGTFQLYVAAFDKSDGSLAAASLVGGEGYQPVAVLTDGKASVKLRLSRKREYRVVFFAMKEGAYTPFFGNNNSARIGISQTNPANDASMDAFYAGVDVSAAKTSYDITLKRPFAQLNVLVPGDNVPDGQTTFKSTMTVKMPIHFDLFSGKAGTTETEVTFTGSAIAAEPFGKYAQTHKWVAMNYVLVPEGGQVEVTSFREDGMTAAVAPGPVPVKMNSRTNLVGNLYGSGLDLAFSVVVDPGFDTPEKILEHEELGCYLQDKTWKYTAGTHQYVREYDGTALTFVLMNPDDKEQMVLTGFSSTMQVGDPVTITVAWRKDKTQQLAGSYDMSVVAIENKKVWIADKKGNGFVIKK